MFFTAQADPQQMIEPDEVIHVGVGDEDMIDLEDHAGRQGTDVTQIEEKGFPAVPHIEVQGRVPEGVVDEPHVEHEGPFPALGPGAEILSPSAFPVSKVLFDSFTTAPTVPSRSR
jgi:hypothetical protein